MLGVLRLSSKLPNTGLLSEILDRFNSIKVKNEKIPIETFYTTIINWGSESGIPSIVLDRVKNLLRATKPKTTAPTKNKLSKIFIFQMFRFKLLQEKEKNKESTAKLAKMIVLISPRGKPAFLR